MLSVIKDALWKQSSFSANHSISALRGSFRMSRLEKYLYVDVNVGGGASWFIRPDSLKSLQTNEGFFPFPLVTKQFIVNEEVLANVIKGPYF